MSYTTAASIYKPITLNDFGKMLQEGTLEYGSILPFALKADGSPIITARLRPVVKRIKGQKVTVPGDIVHYNITDALSSTGTLTVNQGTNPWIVGGNQTVAFPQDASTKVLNTAPLGSGGNIFLQATDQSLTIQTPFNGQQTGANTFSNTYGAILLSATIVTDNNVGNRSLQIGAKNYSSKFATASSTVDLLDRPLAWPANLVLRILNVGAGDIFSITWVRIS